jgi:hypothetical protein
MQSGYVGFSKVKEAPNTCWVKNVFVVRDTGNFGE